jgi:hypothetical protein
MKNIKEVIRTIIKEESEYQQFFRKALEKAGKSITDMSDEEKKAFFNKIDAAWDGKGEKNEGNAFGAAVTKAKEEGDDEFTVGGKTYPVKESVNEGIGTIALGVAGGLLLLKVLKFVVKKVLGAIGMNAPLPKEKLHKITDELFKKVLVTGGKINMMNVIALRSVIKEMIDKGQITTISQITKVIEKASKEEPKNESINEISAGKLNKIKAEIDSLKSAKASRKDATDVISGLVKQHTKGMNAFKVAKMEDTFMDYFNGKQDWKWTAKKAGMIASPLFGSSFDENVNENFSNDDIAKIKGAVESASSFMGIGSELKKLGMKYDFSTSPLPVYMIKKGSKTFVLVNKKYAEKPDFVVGTTAGGLLEGNVNETKFKSGDKVLISHPTLIKPFKGVVSTTLNAKGEEVLVLKGDKGVWDAKFAKLDEGNAFGMAVTKAKQEGKKEFEFNGKIYKVKKGSYEKNEAAKKAVTENTHVVVSMSKSGYGTLMSKPVSQKDAEKLKKATTPVRGEDLKVISVSDAKALKNKLVGRELLNK